MNKIALIGAKGGMGRRYSAILKHLGVEFIEFDVDDWQHARTTVGIDGVIIVSPTEEHFKNLDQFSANKKIPILCEKPITKDLMVLKEILDWDLNLTMVNQYKYLTNGVISGVTYYDYYNTGKDGLEWDCINIIGLASDLPTINNKSPKWKCMINGVHLNSSAMDGAYVAMIKDWIENPKENKEYIYKAHKRVMDGYYVKGTYRDSSQDKQHEVAREVQHGDQRQDHVGVGSRVSAEISPVHKQGQPVDSNIGSTVGTGGRSVDRGIPDEAGSGSSDRIGARRTKPLSQSNDRTRPGLHREDNQ